MALLPYEPPPPQRVGPEPITLTYDPGSSGGGISRSEGIISALTPLVTIGRFLLGGGRHGREYAGQRITANSGTGQVTGEGPIRGGRGHAQLVKQEAHQIELLQQTFDSGAVAEGVAPYYRDYALQLAQLRRDLQRAAGGTKSIPTPIPNPGDFEPLPPDEFEPPDGGFEDRPIPPAIVGVPGLHIGSPLFPEDFPVPRFVTRFVRGIPGGAAGYNAQTLAGKLQLVGGRAMRGTTRRRRARPAAKAAAPRRRRSASGGRYNSAAWMAKIRKMRGKKKAK